MQQDLFITPQLTRQGNSEPPLLMLAEWLNDRILSIPPFQRAYIWPDEKLRGWWKTIITGEAIGVIVTYQLNGEGPSFIADGLQRLTATLKGLKSPNDYGFSFGPSQAKQICQSFAITRQHRYYKSHSEAMTAFHNLNKGTTLTPLEYYSGILRLDNRGLMVYEKIPQIVFSAEGPLLNRQRNHNRDTDSKLTRDSFALFFQYISEYKGASFWEASRSKILDTSISTSLEKLIVDYVNSELTEQELLRGIDSFEVFLNNQVKIISRIIAELGQTGKTINRSTMRWLLHLAIWRKNNQRPEDMYRSFVYKLLETLVPYETFTSRFPLPDTDPVKFITLNMNQLSGHLSRLCNAFNIQLYEGRKRKKRTAAIGMHNSHIKPFSKNGEGETFFEPASINVARGAKEVGSPGPRP